MKPYLDAIFLVDVLGGEVVGPYQVHVPGPGRSKKDRSLLVMLDPYIPNEPFIFSFADDDPSLCLSYIHSALGIPIK